MRAIVVRSGALGDFAITLPVLDRLRIAVDRLTIVAPARYLALFPHADAWIDADAPEAAALLSGAVRRDDDLGLAYTEVAREGLARCGVRTVLGTSARPRDGTRAHDHFWSPLAPTFGPRDRDPCIEAAPDAVAVIRNRLVGERPVVIAPGSGGPGKRWPIERWRDVASGIAAFAPVLWIGGPIEATEAGWGAPRWDDLDPAGLIALAASCRAWLGVDAGPSHVARAVGAPVGVVFVATDPHTWAPPGARVFPRDASPADLVAWARSVAG